MPDVKPRIPYRQLQAEDTRRKIVVAARRLFAENGYTATSMEALAEEVGVAVRTVYAAFGTKIAILGAICDQWLQEAQVISLVHAAAGSSDPAEVMRGLAEASRRQWESGGDIVDMLQAAAAIDAEIAALLHQWALGREEGMGAALKGISRQLRPGVDLKRANAILQALTAPAVYQSLVRDSGWTPKQYEEWLRSSLSDQLLGPTA
jgi:AcrR family transcriptional regulator